MNIVLDQRVSQQINYLFQNRNILRRSKMLDLRV